MADVFLSYSRKDLAKATVIVKALRAKGWSVFWDQDLGAGRWDTALAKELANAKCVVVLVSADALASDHVMGEAERARSRRTLVPTFLEPSDFTPPSWTVLQHVDLSRWKNPAKAPDWEGLFRCVASLAQQPTPSVDPHLRWHEVPEHSAVPYLRGLRAALEHTNLFDTEDPPLKPAPVSSVATAPADRQPDGSHNDLHYPTMGSRGRRFGRNVPLDRTFPDTANLLKPSPRLVSRELMTRQRFKPATNLNLLAAAWVHLIAHGRLKHERHAPEQGSIQIPLPVGDDWPGDSMRVPLLRPDPAARESARPPAYANLNSHWWDAGQVYGTDADPSARTVAGRYPIDASDALKYAATHSESLEGFRDNYWIGLAALQALLLLEHNHVCDRLAKAFPTQSSRWLFGRASVIIATLMASSLRLVDVLYSFGISHPGIVSLHNYPRHLQHLDLGTGQQLDLAAIDILRDRERGVPRYNEFRKLVGKKPIGSFQELADSPTSRTQIREVYDNDLNTVDLMTGLFAEHVPAGFSISDTAFRVMFLMHARWLKSDRFFTRDFTPETYTKAGIEYVEGTSFVDIIRRHVPELDSAVAKVSNPFEPWSKLPASAPHA